MIVVKDYKIFISHSWSNLNDLQALKDRLNLSGYLNIEFRESYKKTLINSQNAPYLKSVLKHKILNSDIVLSLSDMHSSHSSWIIWELETAKRNNIPIVGIIPKSQKISKEVAKRSIIDVGWHTESIIGAIIKFSKHQKN